MDKMICPCKKVTRSDVLRAMAEGARTFKDIKKVTGAGSKCGKCEDDIRKLLKKHGKDQDKQKDKNKDKGKANKLEHHEQPIVVDALVLECRDAAALADFYATLLGWQRGHDAPGEWMDIVSPTGGTRLLFHQNADHLPPVWPPEPGAPQLQAHLDLAVKDKAAMRQAVELALSLGARLPEAQFGDDKWTTLIDPAGYPFCLVIG